MPRRLAVLLLVLATLSSAHAAVRVTLRHTFRLASAGRRPAFSPDSQLVAITSADGAIRLYRVAGFTLVRAMQHPVGVTAVSFTPDGQLLVSAGYDGNVRIWRVRDGALLRTLSGHHGTVWSVAVSPDGQRIASGGEDKTVRVWRTADGALLHTLTGHALNVWEVAFTRDNQFVVSSSFDHTLKVWRAATGSLVRTMTGHREGVVGLDISRDGQLIASSGDDSTIRLWRTSDGRNVRTFPTTEHTYSVAFSPDGRWIVSGRRERGGIGTLWKQVAGIHEGGSHGTTMQIWRTSDGALLNELKQHADDVFSVAVSPDGRWIVSASDDKTAKVWRVE
jgi:WD40 repeat protein